MIVIDKIEYRNLEEQVRKNQEDIAATKFGLNIVGTVLNVPDLPANANIGDAFLVGRSAPFYVYVKTGNPKTYVNVGTLASTVPGPKGDRGEEGTPGIRGSKWYIGRRVPQMTSDIKHNDMYLNAITGVVYQAVLNDYGALYWAAYDSIRGPMGVPGPKGDKGIQGVPGSKGDKGEKGDSGQAVKLVGILSSTDQLPTPTESIRDNGYLVGNQSDGYNMYVIIGDSSLEWFNTGKFQQVLPPFGTTPNTIYEGSEGQANRDRINLIIQKLADKANGFDLGSVRWGKELMDRLLDDEYQLLDKVLIMDVTSYGTLIGDYSPYGNCIGVYDHQTFSLTVISSDGAFNLNEDGVTKKFGNLDDYLTAEEIMAKINPLKDNVRLNTQNIELINNIIENISVDHIVTEWENGIASEITRPEGALPNYIVDVIGGNTRKCTNLWNEQWELGTYNLAGGFPTEDSTKIRSKENSWNPIIGGKTYYWSAPGQIAVIWFDSAKNYIRWEVFNGHSTVTPPDNASYYKFYINGDIGTTYKNNIMLNYGSDPLPYEPYFPGLKNTIVDDIGPSHVPSFIQELPEYGVGINKEYNNGIVLTDQSSTQILYIKVSDLITLDGSDDEQWVKQSTTGNHYQFILPLPTPADAPDPGRINLVSSWIDETANSIYLGNYGVANNNNYILLGNPSITTVEELKAWLKSYPIQLRYALPEEYQTDIELPSGVLIPLPIIGTPTCEIHNTEGTIKNKAYYSILYQRRIK